MHPYEVANVVMPRMFSGRQETYKKSVISKVQRCKLDPGLKARLVFKISNLMKINLLST